ncbi:MAG: serine/threonine protein kinase [Subtercola sp.]|nr:serine/threonine protein kinase [Subtercola sp.]
MSATTPADVSPSLPGFDYLETIGSGGFSTVYLYEQRLPRRPVAVKALTGDGAITGDGVSGFDERALDRFRDEANLMARLSAHPNILSIYQAGIAEGGEPYLVMEYCAQPGYGARYRSESIAVPEVLAVGVQLAGAVETAHRAGILHRDIKPSNVLVTDFRRPVLADFGISGALGAIHHTDALSAPWAAPEVMNDDAVLRTSSDIYSLGATVYSLLAWRAPFEVPGGDNSFETLRSRAQTYPVAATGRPDAPQSLEAVLATAMATSPSARYTSALAFGRALQQVQHELGLPVTELEYSETSAERASFEDSRARTLPPTEPLAATVIPGAAAGFDGLIAAPPPAPATPPAPPPAAATPPPPATTTPPQAAPAPTAAYGAQPYTSPASAGPLESTVRRDTATHPVYTAPVKKKAVWPGIVIDVVLVVVTAGAAAFYLFGG